jgi:hypothetical protein
MSPFEREKAEDNRFEEFQILENAYRLHSTLYQEVYERGAMRYAELLKHSPSFQKHSKCAQLVQRGYDSTLKNSEKYLREGVMCFAEALGLKASLDAWRYCLTRNFGDYDRCGEDFQRMEKSVSIKMKQLNAATADPKMVAIAESCAGKVSALKLTPKKDFLGSIACVTPKYCPALYRELQQCYRANAGSTRNCRSEVINVFACANDFEFRKSEQFFVQLDGLKLDQMAHPSAQPTSSRRFSGKRPTL